MFLTSQNLYYQLRNREWGHPLPLEKVKNQYWVKNIKDNHFSEPLSEDKLNLKTRVMGLKGLEGQAIVVGENQTMTLWNLEGKYREWTFTAEEPLRLTGRIKKQGEFVICSGNREQEGVIKVLNFQTGQEVASIADLEMDAQRICVVGERIFTALKQGGISEWTLKGEKQYQYVSKKLNHSSFFYPDSFFGLANFLIETTDTLILLHDLQKRQVREIHFPNEKMKLASAYLDREHLICGFQTIDHSDIPHCSVLDIPSGQFINDYRASQAFVHTKIPRTSNQRQQSEEGAVQQILAHLPWVYLGHSNGKIVAVNLKEKTHRILGRHLRGINYLALEGEILISGSESLAGQMAELKFWDLKEMKLKFRNPKEEIKSITTLPLSKSNQTHPSHVCFVAGRVLITTKNNQELFQKNYLIAHKEKNNI